MALLTLTSTYHKILIVMKVNIPTMTNTALRVLKARKAEPRNSCTEGSAIIVKCLVTIEGHPRRQYKEIR
jgi:hypothetical protein